MHEVCLPHVKVIIKKKQNRKCNLFLNILCIIAAESESTDVGYQLLPGHLISRKYLKSLAPFYMLKQTENTSHTDSVTNDKS